VDNRRLSLGLARRFMSGLEEVGFEVVQVKRFVREKIPITRKQKTNRRPQSRGHPLQLLPLSPGTAFGSAVDSGDIEPLSSAQNVANSVSVVVVAKEALHESRPF